MLDELDHQVGGFIELPTCPPDVVAGAVELVGVIELAVVVFLFTGVHNQVGAEFVVVGAVVVFLFTGVHNQLGAELLDELVDELEDILDAFPIT